MAQQPTRYCQQCGTPAAPGQRFCANCGATMDIESGKETARAQDQSVEETRQATPPPPPQVFGQEGMNYAPPPMQSEYQGGGLSYGQSPMQQGYQGNGPSYAPPPMQPGSMANQPPIPKRSAWGTTGCVLIGILVVILAICGGGGYFVYTRISSAVNSTSDSGSVTDGGSTSQATQVATVKTTTFPSNPPQTVNYANVNITLLDAKQATSFADDSGDGSGLLRLDMKLENTYKNGVSLADALNIVLPDGTVVGKSESEDTLYPGGNTTKNTWVDFAAPVSTDVSKVVLRIGAPDEEQINVPLTGHADLSQYQAKSASPNVKTQYAHMDWTITAVKAQTSYQGSQSKQGQMYVYVSFNISNPSTSQFNGYYGSYLRLKSGATTSPPESADSFPLSVAAGQTNVQGTCAFAMPKGSTDFTLIYLADAGGDYPQATANFQIK